MTEEYILQNTGQILLRQITESPIETSESIAAAFRDEVSMNAKNLIDFSELGLTDYGTASVKLKRDSTQFWSIRVISLAMNCPFELIDGILHPCFRSQEQNMSLKWAPPSSLGLTLGIYIGFDGSYYKSGKHYLVAFDANGRQYRIPVSNLYEHCELCHGQDFGAKLTPLALVIDILKSFSSSEWQSDLSSHSSIDHTRAMFRFKPDNTGFIQEPVPEYWFNYCTKISNSIITQNMISPL